MLNTLAGLVADPDGEYTSMQTKNGILTKKDLNTSVEKADCCILHYIYRTVQNSMKIQLSRDTNVLVFNLAYFQILLTYLKNKVTTMRTKKTYQLYSRKTNLVEIMQSSFTTQKAVKSLAGWKQK